MEFIFFSGYEIIKEASKYLIGREEGGRGAGREWRGKEVGRQACVNSSYGCDCLKEMVSL